MKKAYVGIDATDRVRKHGVQVCVPVENETEQIPKRKDGGEKPCLDSSTDKSVDNGVGLSEAGSRTRKDVSQNNCGFRRNIQ